jgi:primosomal protein N''
MKEWLAERAAANYRSVNAEVLAAIQRAIDSDPAAPKNSNRRPRRAQT